MNFEKSKTKINLARAFAGECQAGARYQFIGMDAKMENLKYIQDLMKQLAKNEMAHAKIFYNHILRLGGKKQNNIEICAGYPFNPYAVKDDSLKLASMNELSEHKNIYPSFAKIAQDEGFTEVAKSFNEIAEIESCHYMMLDELAEKYKKGTLFKTKDPIKWKCTKCGYEAVNKKSWDTCPVCKHNQGYTKINIADNPQ